MTKLDTTMTWTTSSDPTARATTWATNPAICSAPPKTHTGWRNSWSKKRGLSPGALVRSAPRCCRALPNAKAQAATRARSAAIPVPDLGPRGADYAGAAGSMAASTCTGPSVPTSKTSLAIVGGGLSTMAETNVPTLILCPLRLLPPTVSRLLYAPCVRPDDAVMPSTR